MPLAVLEESTIDTTGLPRTFDGFWASSGADLRDESTKEMTCGTTISAFLGVVGGGAFFGVVGFGAGSSSAGFVSWSFDGAFLLGPRARFLVMCISCGPGPAGVSVDAEDGADDLAGAAPCDDVTSPPPDDPPPGAMAGGPRARIPARAGLKRSARALAPPPPIRGLRPIDPKALAEGAGEETGSEAAVVAASAAGFADEIGVPLERSMLELWTGSIAGDESRRPRGSFETEDWDPPVLFSSNRLATPSGRGSFALPARTLVAMPRPCDLAWLNSAFFCRMASLSSSFFSRGFGPPVTLSAVLPRRMFSLRVSGATKFWVLALRSVPNTLCSSLDEPSFLSDGSGCRGFRLARKSLLGGVVAFVSEAPPAAPSLPLALPMDEDGEWKLVGPTLRLGKELAGGGVDLADAPIGDDRISPPVLTSCFRARDGAWARSAPPGLLALCCFALFSSTIQAGWWFGGGAALGFGDSGLLRAASSQLDVFVGLHLRISMVFDGLEDGGGVSLFSSLAASFGLSSAVVICSRVGVDGRLLFAGSAGPWLEPGREASFVGEGGVGRRGPSRPERTEATESALCRPGGEVTLQRLTLSLLFIIALCTNPPAPLVGDSGRTGDVRPDGGDAIVSCGGSSFCVGGKGVEGLFLPPMLACSDEESADRAGDGVGVLSSGSVDGPRLRPGRRELAAVRSWRSSSSTWERR